LTVSVNGVDVTCTDGETVATVLLAEEVSAFYRGADGGSRLPFCNMGTCYECTVTIDGRPLQRACMTPVRADMEIVTGAAR
jgi:sarcosine oxidase subunit alpha